MSQPELLSRVVNVLDASGTPYMLTGSYASSLQGEPRLTHDIDLVVALTSEAVSAILDSFPFPDYYLDPIAVREAVIRKGQFNLIDNTTGDKVDFWMLQDDPFDRSRFDRRRSEKFRGQNYFVSSPEDTILMKLRWSEMSGGSEKQLGDVRGVYELQQDVLDLDYIDHWADRLGVADQWRRVRDRSHA
jgi:hypothetical protein